MSWEDGLSTIGVGDIDEFRGVWGVVSCLDLELRFSSHDFVNLSLSEVTFDGDVHFESIPKQKTPRYAAGE